MSHHIQTKSLYVDNINYTRNHMKNTINMCERNVGNKKK